MYRTNRPITATRFGLLTALLCLAVVPAAADVTLPHVLGSNMVVQRDVPVPVWGWAEPGEAITVTLGESEVAATADADGRWTVALPAMQAGGPHQVTVRGKNTIELTNVLVGEVWFCSGQSNMAWALATTKNARDEIAAADYPNVRLFHVPRQTSGLPSHDVKASWQPCTPDTVPKFSAVAYFFGRELHTQLDVPVGLINASWGGTRIGPWTPPAGFASVPKLQHLTEKIEQATPNHHKAVAHALEAIEAWLPSAKEALAAGEPVEPPPAWPKHPLEGPWSPTGLYNGMVHPIVPFAIRGAIWYQGEANLGDTMMYHEKMKALINGWRKTWNQGDFPFYFVQLAPYNYGDGPLRLPMIWEAQTATLALPNTGMAVTTDIGTVRNIHPPNKQDVGKRLALWALAKTYGQSSLIYSGPLHKSMTVEDNKARISFDHVGSGLASRDDKPLTWFEIAAEDKKFVEAQAAIDGDTVLVWSDEVAVPVAVRFGWNQVAQPNLMNKEGLPASPFRTDQW